MSDRFASWLEYRGLVYVYDRVDSLPRVNTNFLSILGEGFLTLLLMIIAFVGRYKNGRLRT